MGEVGAEEVNGKPSQEVKRRGSAKKVQQTRPCGHLGKCDTIQQCQRWQACYLNKLVR